MKATKQNKNISINFSTLDALMLAVHKAEVRLADALRSIWNQHSNACPKAFREAFIAYAVGKGYDRRWAMETLVEVGKQVFEGKNLFRARAEGGGRKPSKASASKPSKANKPTRADQIDLSAMPKGELQKLILAAAARI